MATFDKYNPNDLVKLIICGETKSGKTGLLATLLKAPFIKRMMVLDFDNGMNIIRSYAGEADLAKLSFMSFDKSDPQSAPKAASAAMHWKDATEDLGHYTKWDGSHVLVVDSLTFMGDAFAVNAEHTMQQRKDRRADDFRAVMGEAQKNMEKFVAHCFFRLPCHVIFNTHIKGAEAGGRMQDFPSTIGVALSQKIGRYANDVYRIDIKPGGKRVIRTVGDHHMSLGNSAPKVMKEEEDFNLTHIFTKLMGSRP